MAIYKLLKYASEKWENVQLCTVRGSGEWPFIDISATALPADRRLDLRIESDIDKNARQREDILHTKIKGGDT